MKYAFVSDIHGNLQAWTQVWASLTAENVDGVICLGDIIGYGPRPAETLASVKSKVNFCVIGNHDAVIAGLEDPSRFNKEAQKLISWSAERMDQDAIEYFSALPYELNLDTENEVIRCVHGSPFEPELFWYVSNATEARLAWDSTDAQVTFIGHSHVPGYFTLSPDNKVKYREGNNLLYEIEEGYRYIINAGSVGLSRDGDRRAAYCIYDSENRNFYWRRIDFDLEEFRRDVKNSMPDKEMAAFVLDNFELSVETQAIKKFSDFQQPTDETQRLTIDRKATVETINVRKNFIKRKKTGSTQTMLPIKKEKSPSPAKTKLIVFLIAALILALIVGVIFIIEINRNNIPKNKVNPRKQIQKSTTETKTPKKTTEQSGRITDIKNSPARKPEDLIRYIRLDHKTDGIFNIAEIEVYRNGKNIARGAKVTSKSPGTNGTKAMNLVDGYKGGKFTPNGFYHSPAPGNNEWILMDLGKPTNIDSIKIYNRTDKNNDCHKRILGSTVSILNAEKKEIKSGIIEHQKDIYTIDFEQPEQPAPPQTPKTEKKPDLVFILNEKFNSEQNGEKPQNFWLKPDGCPIEIAPIPSSSDKSIILRDNSTTNFCGMAKSFKSTSGIVGIRFKVRPEQKNHGFSITLLDDQDKLAFQIKVTREGTLGQTYKDAKGKLQVIKFNRYETGKFMTLRIVADTKLGLYSLFKNKDKTPILKEKPFINKVGNLGKIRFVTGKDTTGVFYIDNVQIYTSE